MTFSSKPLRPQDTNKFAHLWNRVSRKNPLLFGVPFVLTVVIASFGLSSLTQTRYDLHDNKISQVSQEEMLHMSKNRRKIDIREEYFRLQSGSGNGAVEDDWEPIRVPRPEGTPEWGVPPPGPSR